MEHVVIANINAGFDLEAIRENFLNIPDVLNIIFDPASLTEQNSVLIGVGTCGRVYRVFALNPNLAVKVMQVNANNTRLALEMAIEIRKLHTLRHENIIRIEYYFCPSPNVQVGDCIGFFMEYAPYRSLANVMHWLEHDQLDFDITWAIALRWLKGIASALAYMHERNQKHMDLKPENILIFDEYVAKLCDFGLTTNHGNSESLGQDGATDADAHLPFEIRNGNESQLASDLYGFGVVAGYLLAQRPCPQVLVGRPNKAARLDNWMTSSPYMNERGFGLLKHYVLTCLDDDWTQRPLAMRMVEIIDEIEP